MDSFNMRALPSWFFGCCGCSTGRRSAQRLLLSFHKWLQVKGGRIAIFQVKGAQLLQRTLQVVAAFAHPLLFFAIEPAAVLAHDLLKSRFRLHTALGAQLLRALRQLLLARGRRGPLESKSRRNHCRGEQRRFPRKFSPVNLLPCALVHSRHPLIHRYETPKGTTSNPWPSYSIPSKPSTGRRGRRRIEAASPSPFFRRFWCHAECQVDTNGTGTHFAGKGRSSRVIPDCW